MMGEVFRVIFTRTNRLGLDFAGRLGLGSDFESNWRVNLQFARALHNTEGSLSSVTERISMSLGSHFEP